MRAHFEHLLEAATLPNVTIQCGAFPAGVTPPRQVFTILRFAAPDLPDVVYLERLTSALYLDDRLAVDHYMEVMGTSAGGPNHPLPQRDHPGIRQFISDQRRQPTAGSW